MRILSSAIAVLAALGLGTLSTLGAGAPTAKTAVDAQVDVPANRATGTTFTAPEAGTYRFTIVSGAFCYLPLKAGEASQYGGWLTQIEIHTKAVTWGSPDEWGKHPLHAAAIVGDKKHQATSAAAEAAGKGATTTVTLQKGSQVTLLVSDGSDYYGDNKGVIKVRITPVNGAAAPAAPATPPASSTTPTTPATPEAPAGAIPDRVAR